MDTTYVQRVATQAQEYVSKTIRSPQANSLVDFLRRLYRFEGAIGRQEYGLSLGISLFYNLFLYPYILHLPLGVLIHTILYIAILAAYCCQAVKRCHDLQMSGWWAWLPIFNPLLLLFLPKAEGVWVPATAANGYYYTPHVASVTRVGDQKGISASVQQHY